MDIIYMDLSGLTDYLAVFPLQVFAPHLFPFLFIPAQVTHETPISTECPRWRRQQGGGVCVWRGRWRKTEVVAAAAAAPI